MPEGTPSPQRQDPPRADFGPRRALDGLRSAVTLLTVLPMGRFELDPKAAVAWYPWVGWLFGAVGFGIAQAFWALTPDRLGLLLQGLLTVTAWTALSGLLHWDGVADTADGLLGRHSAKRRLEVMRDSRVGAFGALALVLAVSVESVAIALSAEGSEWWAIVMAPVVGRAVAVLTVMVARPARVEGFGASVATRSAVGALWAGIGLVAAVVLVPPASLPALAVAAVAGCGASLGMARLAGGYTGDTLGAGIVAGEIAVLLAGAFMTMWTVGRYPL